MWATATRLASAVAPDRRGQRGRAGPDVGAEHDGDGAVEGQEALVREREREPESGRRRRHQRAEDGPDQHADRRALGDRGEKIQGQGRSPERSGVVENELQAEEHEAEPEQRLPQVLRHTAARDERGREAETDQERRVVRDAERDQLHRERRADVGAEDDAERLPERHQARGDEADQHQGRGRRRLQERRRRRARQDREHPAAREAREQILQPGAEHALQRLAAQTDPVEQQRHPAEQRHQDRHCARSVSEAGGRPVGVPPSTTLATTSPAFLFRARAPGQR